MNRLSKDQILEQCPVAFSNEPTNPELSGRYVYMSTEVIIDDMEKLGWFPVKASMRNKHKEDSIYSKHMITFRNPDITIKGEDGDDSIPEIILVNSYDGYTSLRFYVGVFRFVCENGLVVADRDFEHFSMAHKGYSFESLRELLSEKVLNLPKKVEVLNDMLNKHLTEDQIKEFAVNAMLIRTGTPFNKLDLSEANYDDNLIQEITEPKRKLDEGNSLWAVFNRVQETLVSGGIMMPTKTGKQRKMSKIKSFDRHLEFNKNLFILATDLI